MEISVKGAVAQVPSFQIGERIFIVTGKWLKTASVHDEEWRESGMIADPEGIVQDIRLQKDLRIDVFTFTQSLKDPTPRFRLPYAWESIAAIPLPSFEHWWNNLVSSDLRKDVRKAAKRGVVVRKVEFSDEFVRSLVDIYNETPIRQGKPFWYYQKGFEAAKACNATYLDRSTFLAAFYADEMIGFLKMVRVNQFGRLMQILAKDAHRDKRPMNALVAKAVEICHSMGCSYLTYGKYEYAQGPDGLTEFKHRTGFTEIRVPRYFAPVTIKGRIAIQLGVQSGVRPLMPKLAMHEFKKVRASVYGRMSRKDCQSCARRTLDRVTCLKHFGIGCSPLHQ